MLSRGLTIAVLLGLVLLSNGCGKNLTDTEYVERAREFQEKGQLQSSVIELKNALQKNPANLEARSLLGKIYVEVGDGTSAEKELRSLLDRGTPIESIAVPLAKSLLLQGKFADVPALNVNTSQLNDTTKATLFVLRGKAYLAQRKVNEAAEQFQLALKAKPDSEDTLTGQALLSMQQQQWGEARRWNEKALAVAPNSAEAWSLQGYLEQQAGERNKAEEAYTKAIQNRFDHGQDLLKRALVRVELQNYAGAEKDVQTLQQISPSYPRSNYVQGRIYFEQKRFADAQRAFEEELKYNQNNTENLYYLALAHLAQDHQKQAAEYLKSLANLLPQSDQVAKLLAQAYIGDKDLAKAESMLQEVLKRKPNDPEAIKLMGTVRAAQGDTGKGIEYLKKAVVSQPTIASTRLELGVNLLETGEKEQGIKELEKAIELDPQLQQADILLILNLLRDRQFDKALAVASGFVKKEPDQPVSHTLLGMVYRAKGNDDQARAEFEQALKLQPGYSNAEMNLAALDAKAGNTAGAEAHYQRILQHDAGHVGALLGLAELARQAGKPDQVFGWLEKAWERHPDSQQIGITLAQQYLNRRENFQALSVVQSLYTVYPNDPLTIRAVGLVQLANGNIAAAQENFRKLTGIQPKSPESWHLLAMVQLQANDYAVAAGNLDKALVLDSKYLPALVSRTNLQLNQQHFKEALADAHRIQAQYPDQGIGYALEGNIYLQQKDYAKAIAAYQTAYAKTPTGPLAQRLAEIFKLSGDEAAAAKYMQLAQQDSNSQPGQAGNAPTARNPEPGISPQEVESILKLLQSKAYDEAGKVAAELVKKAPDSPIPHALLGMIHLARGQDEQGRGEFQQALQLNPDYSLADINLAWLDRKSGNQALAETRYRRVLERHAQQPQVIVGIARSLDRSGHADMALGLLERAWQDRPEPTIGSELVQHYVDSNQSARGIEVARRLQADNPDNPIAVRALGLTLLADQQSDEALKNFRRLTELQPQSPEAWQLLASAALRSGNDKAAEKALDKALAVQDNYLPALVSRTELQLKQKHFQDALGNARKIQTAYPDSSMGYWLEGESQLLQGDLDKAAAAYQTALAKSPDSRVIQRLSLVQYNLGKPQAALDLLHQWLVSNPADTDSRLQLAGMRRGQNQPAEALAEYRRVLIQEPKNVNALNGLAWLYQEAEDGRGLELAEQAVALAPNRPDIADTLGWILVKRGQVERGIQVLQRAAAQAPKIPTIRYHLAAAYAEQGRNSEARQLLEELLKSAIPFPEQAAAQALRQQIQEK
ncbi:MAG: XrtA/PEP-CTERM system TPR-repeat protein PrsT [Candidatus Competibacteraceae bacterium]